MFLGAESVKKKKKSVQAKEFSFLVLKVNW
jgi:hypothetical protein